MSNNPLEQIALRICANFNTAGMTTEEAAAMMRERMREAFPPNAEDAIKAAKIFISHNHGLLEKLGDE